MANVAGPSAFVGKVSVMLRHSGTRAVARATSGSRPSSRRAGASTRAPPVARSPGAEPGPPGERAPSPAGDAGAPGGRGAGGTSPTARYTRLLAHGYEITTPDATTRTSGAQDHRPMTLCQLKSRALLRRPRRKTVTLRSVRRVQ